MSIVLALLVALVAFTGTAFAASGAVAAAQALDAAPPDASWLDLAKPVFEAVAHGNGYLAAALALVLLVTLARKYGAERFPFLKSKAGGALANVLLGFGGMLATAFGAGTMPSWALVLTSLKVSVFAAGGFTLIKELAVPALRWLESKLPASLRPLIKPAFDLALWAFEPKKTAATKVAEAEAAGEAAVKAAPAKGAEGVVRKGKSFP